jgi:environmental stress-induced protein Ves
MDMIESGLPCRILVVLEGLEMFLYNNTGAYEQVRKQLDLSEFSSNPPTRTTTNEHTGKSWCL